MSDSDGKGHQTSELQEGSDSPLAPHYSPHRNNPVGNENPAHTEAKGMRGIAGEPMGRASTMAASTAPGDSLNYLLDTMGFNSKPLMYLALGFFTFWLFWKMA